MARFIYRMQSILDIKNKMENQAKMDYAQAKNALILEEEKLAFLYQRKDGYEEEIRELFQDTLKVKEIIDCQAAVLRMDEFIAFQKEARQRAENFLEEQRQKLEEVMKERKTHEKLKEKAFEEFKLDENAKESKEIDELTSYTYGMKQQENDSAI